MLYSFFIHPFADFLFLKRALVLCIILSFGCAPVGVFLVLRRMTLLGDALSHAILPGVAGGFLIFGLSLIGMLTGGLFAGFLIALAAGWVTRNTSLKEDASFTGFYLVSLALGVLLVSMKGTNVDLMHVLFGNILAIDAQALALGAIITTLTLMFFAIFYRPLLLECFDPTFLQVMGQKTTHYSTLFLLFVVLNLVSAFQSLGTLMALGMVMLPAITAKLWTKTMGHYLIFSSLLCVICSYLGLLFSYHLNVPSGPAIILFLGAFYFFSLIFGREGGFLKRSTFFK
jgi:zinc/manganese transport system permease protein